MDSATVAEWITTGFNYPRPGWTITAQVGAPIGNIAAPVLVTILLDAPDSNPANRGQTETLARHRLIDPATMDTTDDVRRWLAVFILSLDVHESLEWMLIGDDHHPIYHPHTATGQDAWAADRAHILGLVRP